MTFEICLLTFSVYIGSAIYTADILDVTREFGVSTVAATLGLTLFVAGYGIGPMIWSPLSEIPQIGHNPDYILTLVLFVVLQVPTALATNFGMLLAFRFLTGFIGSPSWVKGGASIGDMYRPAKRTYGLAVWAIGAVSGPTLGPLIGGFACQGKGLEVDDLGAHVVVGVHACATYPLPAGDIVGKHSAPTKPPFAQAHGKRQAGDRGRVGEQRQVI